MTLRASAVVVAAVLGGCGAPAPAPPAHAPPAAPSPVTRESVLVGTLRTTLQRYKDAGATRFDFSIVTNTILVVKNDWMTNESDLAACAGL